MDNVEDKQQWNYHWKRSVNGEYIAVFMLGLEKKHLLVFSKDMKAREKIQLEQMFADDGFIKTEDQE